jgi:hypothetical protein
MKRLLLAIAAIAALLASPAVNAEQINFYNKDISELWKVAGLTDVNKRGDALCSGYRGYRDGGEFDLTKNLGTGFAYIYMQNPKWNFSPAQQNHELPATLTFYDKDHRIIEGGNFVVSVHDNTTITIRKLGDEVFSVFAQSDFMKLKIKGVEVGTVVYFENAQDVLHALSECVRAYDSLPPTPAKPKGEQL